MKIIIACERYKRVRDAFIAKGHDAWSCDIEPSDGNHIQADVLTVIDEGWDMMIAFPPCTHLASSGALRFPEKRADGRQKAAIDFFMKLVKTPIKKKVIENPIGIMSTIYRKPDQIIHPNWFGEDASKSTCLWLFGGLPLLVPTKYIEPRWVCCGIVLPDGFGKYGCPKCNGDNVAKPRWGNQTNSGQNKLAPSEKRASERGKTYLGIAQAMADQWG